MKRPFPLLAVALSVAATISAASLAAPTVRVVPDDGGARLLVGKKLITFFRTPNGKLSPQDRAERAADRLRELIAGGLRPEDIDARPRGENWAVYANGGLLMIATQEEAEQRKEDPETVARRWAANLKDVLKSECPAERPSREKPSREKPSRDDAREKPSHKAEPAIGVNDNDVTVPLGEKRTVTVTGSAMGAISVKVDSDAVSATAVPGKPVVELRGLSTGKATVTISRDGKEIAVTVRVKKLAGRVPDTLDLQVTGSASASVVRRLAEQQAIAAADCESGALVRCDSGAIEGVKPVGRGQEAVVRLPISITGGDYLPFRTVVKARVRNISLPPKDASWLLYSNAPETVKEYGRLYCSAVENDGPTRLFFHHQNRMGRPFLLQVHLLNPNDAPVDVHVVEGGAGPLLDTIQVGHRAGERYMAATLAETGYVARIPAHGTRTIYSATLPNNLTVSGIYGLRILNGGPLVTEVTASADPVRPEVTDGLLEIARKDPQRYPSPLKEKSYAYHVGDRWTFIPLGREAITGTTPNRKLFGNYGVVYDLTVDVENPTEVDKTVKLVFSAEAGWVRGVFVIDGKLIEAPELAPPGESVLWSVKLSPKEHQRVHIRTIPVGGSFYPASIVVRS